MTTDCGCNRYPCDHTGCDCGTGPFHNPGPGCPGQPDDTPIHILIDRTATGDARWKLGGGSSTPAQARVYASHEKAEAGRKRLRSGRTAQVVTLPLEPPTTGNDLVDAELVLHGLGQPFWRLATEVAIAAGHVEEARGEYDRMREERDALRATLKEACCVAATGRIGQIGRSQVYTPQVNVEAVARWRAVLASKHGTT